MRLLQTLVMSCLAAFLTSCGSDNEATQTWKESPQLNVPVKPSQPNFKLKQDLLGKWEGKNDSGQTGVLDFQEDGKLVATLKEERPEGERNEMFGQYKVVANDAIEQVWKWGPEIFTEKVKVNVDGDTMTFTDKKGKISKFTKIK